MRPTLRQNIVSSTLTLPVCGVLCAVLWMCADVRDLSLWGGLMAAGVLTYILMEMVNRNQLLRIRSRMVSVTFVCWLAASPFLHAWHVGLLPAFALLGALFLLFASYQKERAEHEVFHAFLLLTLGSFVFPPLIVLALVFYVAMAVQLRSLTLRTLGASLLGILTPLWFAAAWAILWGRTAWVADRLAPWLTFRLPDYTTLSLHFWLNTGFLVWQLLLGLLHYYRTNFNDKIRVRMCYYVLILTNMVLLAGLFLYPEHFRTLFLLQILCTSPLVGHYYALARGRGWMTFWFLLNVLLLIALGVFNYFFA